MTFEWELNPNLPNPKWFILAVIILTLIAALIFTSMVHAKPACSKKLTASWYDRTSLIKEGTWKNGKEQKMANGKAFNENALTCASWDFPLKTKLRVTTLEVPKKSIVVEVTDRINKRFKGKRIDLARAAMQTLGGKQALDAGLIKVRVEVIK